MRAFAAWIATVGLLAAAGAGGERSDTLWAGVFLFILIYAVIEACTPR